MHGVQRGLVYLSIHIPSHHPPVVSCAAHHLKAHQATTVYMCITMHRPQAAYDLLLEPILNEFNPELVIIGAGFDAAEGDLMGGCHMTPAGYGQLASRLMRLAGGRVVAVLEGGYNTE